MKFSIVGLVKNAKSAIIGYVVFDDNTHKFSMLQKNKVIAAVQAKKVKFTNARYNGRGISGIYYSLEDLSYVVIDSGKQQVFYRGVLILGSGSQGKYRAVELSAGGSLCKYSEITIYQLYDLLNNHKIINVDEYGNLSIKSDPALTSSTVNKIAAIKKQKELQSMSAVNTANMSDEQINAEAINPDIEWTIDKFIRYMEMHNWKYTIIPLYGELYRITGIDKDCDVVHLPNCVVSIDSLYESRPTKPIKSLIIPKSCTNISSMYPSAYSNSDDYNSQLLKIGKVVFQGKTDFSAGAYANTNSERRTYAALNHLDLGEIIGLKAIIRIAHAFNYSKIAKFDYNDTCNLYDVDRSFRNVQIENCIYAEEFNAREYSQSFCNIPLPPVIKFAKHIKSIHYSFNMSDSRLSIDSQLSSIIIPDESRLDTINDSFSGHNNLVSVDLSNLDKLSEVSGFCFCSNLSSFKLPSKSIDTRVHVNSPFLYQTQVKELVVSNNFYGFTSYGLDKVLSPDATVIVDESVTDFPNMVVKCKLKILAKRLSLTRSLLSTLNSNCYKDGKFTLTDCGVDKDSIFEIKPNAFNHAASLKLFDSGEVQKISSIKDSTFVNSGIETLILRDNIKTIGETIVRDCEHLSTILIDSRISTDNIDSKAFTYIRSRSVIKVFIVNNEKLYKWFLRRNANSNQFDIKHVNTIEDAMYIINGEANELNKSFEAKFKILCNEDKYQILMTEPYLRNAENLYSIYENLKGWADGKDLNTDKYIDMPLSVLNIPNINDMTGSDVFGVARVHSYSGTDINTNHQYVIDTVFNGFSNLITSVFTNNIDLVSDKMIAAYGESKPRLSRRLFNDGNRLIGILTINSSKSMFLGMGLLVIIIGNRLKFITHFDYNKISNYTDASCFSSLINVKALGPSIAGFLKPGDSIHKSSNTITLAGGPAPNISNIGINEHYNILDYIKLCSVIGLDIKSFDKSTNKVPAILYDMITQTVIEGVITNEKGCGVLSHNYSSILITKVVQLSDIFNGGNEPKQIDSKFFELLQRANRMNPIYENKFKYLMTSQEELKEIQNNPKNYDYVSVNNSTVTLAKLFYRNGIDSAEKLTNSALASLYKTAFFTELNLAVERISGDNCIYNYFDTHTIEGYGNILERKVVDHRLKKSNKWSYNYRFITHPDSTKYSQKSRIKVMASAIALNKIVKLMYECGKANVNNIAPVGRLQNEYIDINRFYICEDLSTRKSLNNYEDKNNPFRRCFIMLGFDKANLEPYLLAYPYESELSFDEITQCFTILRFKDIYTAVDWYFTYCIPSSIRYNGTVGYSEAHVVKAIRLILNESLLSETSTDYNFITEARKAIMLGAANNAPIPNISISDTLELLNILAKQPLKIAE